MLIFCCLVALTGGAYAFVKWLQLEHPYIPWLSLVLTLFASAGLVASKFSLVSKVLIGQLMAGAIVIYMSALVYGLGGIASNHSFWLIASIIYVYLITSYKTGLVWTLFLCGVVLYGLIAEYHLEPIPVFDLGPKEKFKVALSGHLVPMLFTSIAMAYIIKLR